MIKVLKNRYKLNLPAFLSLIFTLLFRTCLNIKDDFNTLTWQILTKYFLNQLTFPTPDDAPRRRRHEVRGLQEALGSDRRDGQGVDGKAPVHGHRLAEAGRDR